MSVIDYRGNLRIREQQAEGTTSHRVRALDLAENTDERNDAACKLRTGPALRKRFLRRERICNVTRELQFPAAKRKWRPTAADMKRVKSPSALRSSIARF